MAGPSQGFSGTCKNCYRVWSHLSHPEDRTLLRTHPCWGSTGRHPCTKHRSDYQGIPWSHKLRSCSNSGNDRRTICPPYRRGTSCCHSSLSSRSSGTNQTPIYLPCLMDRSSRRSTFHRGGRGTSHGRELRAYPCHSPSACRSTPWCGTCTCYPRRSLAHLTCKEWKSTVQPWSCSYTCLSRKFRAVPQGTL